MEGQKNDPDSIPKRAFVYSILTIKSKDNQNNSSIVLTIGCNQQKIIVLL
jgi:hypothetical protein